MKGLSCHLHLAWLRLAEEQSHPAKSASLGFPLMRFHLMAGVCCYHLIARSRCLGPPPSSSQWCGIRRRMARCPCRIGFAFQSLGHVAAFDSSVVTSWIGLFLSLTYSLIGFGSCGEWAALADAHLASWIGVCALRAFFISALLLTIIPNFMINSYNR